MRSFHLRDCWQSHRVRPFLSVGILALLGLPLWSVGCSNSSSPGTSFCASSQDCKAGESCQNTICTNLSPADASLPWSGIPICAAGQTRPCSTTNTQIPNVGECKQGTQTCNGDSWGPCEGEVFPTKEICNDKDDDCDGQVDNGFRVGRPCTVGIGACQNTGKYICTAEGTATCDATPSPAGPKELCNNQIDGNCDGSVDEGCECVGEEVRSCAPSEGNGCVRTRRGNIECKGICRAGQQTCENNKWGRCIGGTTPVVDECNGQDDDCDGQVDNVKGSTEPLSQPCYTGDPNVKGQGECREGRQICVQGTWGPCENQVTPVAEQCDGKDNDCNGQSDEICGPSYPHAAFQTDQTQRRARGFRFANVGSGTNQNTVDLEPTDPTNNGCSDNILIATSQVALASGISYECVTSDSAKPVFRVHTYAAAPTKPTLSPTGLGFHALMPKDGTYGHIACQKTEIGPVTINANCKVSWLRGSNVNVQIALFEEHSGIVKFTTDACKDATQPVFATLYGKEPGYIRTLSYGQNTGKCEVQIFDAEGKPTIRDFVFWLPPKDKTIWADIKGDGTIAASNGSHPSGKVWTASPTQAGSGGFDFMSVTSLLWATPHSIVLLAPRMNCCSASEPAYSASFLFDKPSSTPQLKVYTFKKDQPSVLPPNNPAPKSNAVQFTILLANPH